MFSFSFWCTLSTGWFGVLELVLLVIVVGVLVGVLSVLVVCCLGVKHLQIEFSCLLSYALSCFLYLIGLLKCLNITSWKKLFVIRVHMVLIVIFVVVVIIVYCA